MFVVIKMEKCFDERIRDLYTAWREEHANYYGRPCGQKAADTPRRILELGGYNPTRCNLGLNFLSAGGWFWLRCSGNWAGCSWSESEGQWTVWIESRRHGIPQGIVELFDNLIWHPKSKTWSRDGVTVAACEVLESQNPEVNPIFPVSKARQQSAVMGYNLQDDTDRLVLADRLEDQDRHAEAAMAREIHRGVRWLNGQLRITNLQALAEHLGWTSQTDLAEATEKVATNQAGESWCLAQTPDGHFAIWYSGDPYANGSLRVLDTEDEARNYIAAEIEDAGGFPV